MNQKLFFSFADQKNWCFKKNFKAELFLRDKKIFRVIKDKIKGQNEPDSKFQDSRLEFA